MTKFTNLLRIMMIMTLSLILVVGYAQQTAPSNGKAPLQIMQQADDAVVKIDKLAVENEQLKADYEKASLTNQVKPQIQARNPYSVYNVKPGSSPSEVDFLVEDWASLNFATNGWTFTPSQPTNWSVTSGFGNPFPSAQFFYSPSITLYSFYMESAVFNTAAAATLQLKYDFYLSNYSSATLEQMGVEVFDGTSWVSVANYTNVGGSIPWTSAVIDVTAYKNANFQARFHVYGDNSFNINNWNFDNIIITEPSATPVLVVSPAGPFDYGNVQLGNGPTQQFVIANNAGGVATVSNIAVAGDASFSVSASALGNLPPDFVYADVTFTPTATGPQSAVLTFTTSEGDFTVSLSGNGIPVIPNDDCATATYVDTYPSVQTGTCNGAEIDCPGVLDWPAVWYELELPYAFNNVNINFCGTLNMNTVGVVYYNDCSDCSAYLFTSYSFITCPGGETAADENITGIPGPTTIFYPVYAADVDLNPIDFTVTFDVTEAIPGTGCENTVQFGTATVNGSGLLTTISTCSYAGEYSTVNGIVAGETYQFTMSDLGTGTFITITDGLPTGANILAYGTSPVSWTATTSGTLYAHWNLDNLCNTDASCHTTTVQCTTCSTIPPPANDNCANAIAVGEVTDLAFNTESATFDGPGGCMSSPNVWYNYTATVSGDLTVDLCGTGWDTKLAIYDSFDCATMVSLACNDDNGPACAGLESSIFIPGIVAGEEYKIEVGGFSSNAGPGDLTISVFEYLAHNVGVVSIDMGAIVGPGITTPMATIENIGQNGETFDVTMTITPGYSSTVSVTMAQGDPPLQVSFDPWDAMLGNYTVDVCTQLATDLDPANDCILAQPLSVQELRLVYGYVAYDPSLGLPEGPAYFYVQDPGTITSLAATTSDQFIAAGTWANGVWYGSEYFDGATGGGWWTIDPTDGTMTKLGDFDLGFAGITYDPSTDIMYGTYWDGANDVLYTINPADGTPTMLGNFSTQLMINLAADGSGFLYGIGLLDDQLYQIDPAAVPPTAVAIGSTGYNFNYAQDMEYDFDNDIMYIAAYHITGELMTIDLTTAACTPIGEFQGGSEITAFAIPSTPGFRVYGNVYYGNTGTGKPMDANTTMILNPGAYAEPTGAMGYYEIGGIADGAYLLTGATTKPGNNSQITTADGIVVTRMAAGIGTPYSTLQYRAGDVNASNAVTTSDAILVKRRAAGLTSPFAAPVYVFDGPFGAPNPVLGGIPVNVAGADVLQNMRCLLSGDLNSSHTP